MKSILFIMQLPPPIHGASVMNKTIENSQLINSSFICDYINLSSSTSASDLGKHNIKKYFKLLSLYKNVFLHLLNNTYDLCYITLTPSGIGFIKDSFVVVIAKLLKKKLLFHFHGKGMNSYYESSNPFLKKYINFIFNNASVIHLSETLLNDFEHIGTIKKTYIVANGIEKGMLGREKKYLHENVLKILFLSSMIETKGVLTALKTIVMLSKKIDNFKLSFVGAFRNKSFQQEVDDFVDNNNIGNYVDFLGPIYGEEKSKVFLNHDIFFAPTKNDAFPLVILEAMQYGLPVISTYQGGIPDIVKDGETGFLVDENNIQQFTEKIIFFSQNINYISSYGEEGRKDFLKYYTIEIFEKKLYTTLNNIIKENK